MCVIPRMHIKGSSFVCRLLIAFSIIMTYTLSVSPTRSCSDDEDYDDYDTMERIISAMQPAIDEVNDGFSADDFQPHGMISRRTRRRNTIYSRNRYDDIKITTLPEDSSKSKQGEKSKKYPRLKRKRKTSTKQQSHSMQQQTNKDQTMSSSRKKLHDDLSIPQDKNQELENFSIEALDHDNAKDTIVNNDDTIPQSENHMSLQNMSSSNVLVETSSSINYTTLHTQDVKAPTATYHNHQELRYSYVPDDYALSMTSPWVRQFLKAHPYDQLLPIPLDFLSDGFNFHRIHTVIDQLIFNFNRRMDNNIHGLQESSWKKISTIVYREALGRLVTTNTTTTLDTKELESTVGSKTMNNRNHLSDNIDSRSPLYIQLGLPDSLIEKSAEIIFLLIHARFVTSPRGMEMVKRMMNLIDDDQMIRESSKQGEDEDGIRRSMDLSSHDIIPIFGKCPRLHCGGMPLLPCGLSDDYDERSEWEDMFSLRALRYCCNCGEVRRIDHYFYM